MLPGDAKVHIRFQVKIPSIYTESIYDLYNVYMEGEKKKEKGVSAGIGGKIGEEEWRRRTGLYQYFDEQCTHAIFSLLGAGPWGRHKAFYFPIRLCFFGHLSIASAFYLFL